MSPWLWGHGWDEPQVTLALASLNSAVFVSPAPGSCWAQREPQCQHAPSPLLLHRKQFTADVTLYYNLNGAWCRGIDLLLMPQAFV